MESATIRALADITDEGLFEQIATAILRTVPDYASLAHPGLTADGKTRKSPLDGVCFAGDACDHLIMAHHTTTAARGLERKWLLDPETLVRRKTNKSHPSQPGDLIKARDIVREERARTPTLRATLILTTNQEPDAELQGKITAAGRAEHITVDIWTRSRIAYVLDSDPVGQIIRRKLLGFEEELLSRELLGELAIASTAAFDAGDDPRARVGRAWDDQLTAVWSPVTFLVADSGAGKTVACHKLLGTHARAGGVALIVPNTVVEQTPTLDQAVMTALRALKPTLAPGQSPLALVSEEDPLLVLIEDVSRSSQPQRLIEKITGWASNADASGARSSWRVLCPVWPHLLSGLTSQASRRVAALALRPESMSLNESAAAAALYARQSGVELVSHQARGIAAALGRDPLLIALNRNWSDPRPEGVIEQFIDEALARAQSMGRFLATELRAGLLALGEQLLIHRALEPAWNDVLSFTLSPETIAAVKEVARHAEILRIDGPSSAMRIRFRHDRVRDWLLTEAAVALDRNDKLTDTILAEPMTAEIVGAVLVRENAPDRLIARVKAQAPLALFHALRLTRPTDPTRERIAASAQAWLAEPSNQGRATSALRWQALAAIADVEGDFMVALVARFPLDWATGMIARMRNADLEGGIALCGAYDLQTAVAWLRWPVAAARAKADPVLTQRLMDLIDADAGRTERRQAALLRFAGAWGSPALTPALLRFWSRDAGRNTRLDLYIWALARCATPQTAAALLAPVCAEWGALPNARGDGKPSPRDDLVAHSVRWAFECAIPVGAIDYLIARAAEPDLAWPIEYLLHGIDHPSAVLFQARTSADRRQKSLQHYAVSFQARDHWRRTHEGYGEPMSNASRTPLKALWQDPNADEHLRIAAFDLWAACRQRDDIAILRRATKDALLADRILRQRLERGDHAAIPELILQLDGHDGVRWWHYARHVWSSSLYDALDRALARAATSVSTADVRNEAGYTLMSVILRLSTLGAERLLLRYWKKLGQTMHFVQAALYVATPELRAKADAVIRATESPERLLEHLSMNYGIRMQGEPGITHEVQIVALEPYLEMIDDSDLQQLADACNKNGWLDLRRRLLDPRIEDAKTGTPEHIRRELNDRLARGHVSIIDYDVDRWLEVGATWPEIASVLRDWLAKQVAPNSLELAAVALRHAGRREDVALLAAWAGDDDQLRKDVIADTRFAVHRRRDEPLSREGADGF